MRSLGKWIAAALACSATLAWGDVEVDHDPVEQAKTGERIPLSASISGAPIRTARAYFKSSAGSRFFFVPLAASTSNEYVGMMPAPRLGADKIDYFLLAATSAGDIVRTESFVINVEDDEDALARSEVRDAKEIEIDLDKFEQAQDLVDRLGSKPDPAQQVPVGSESPVQNPQIPGFQDFIVAAQQAELLASASPLGSSTAASGGGGLGTTGWVIVGAAAVGAGAAAGGGGGGGGGGTSPAPTGVQIGPDFPPPNGGQQAPIAFELIPIGGATVSPLRLRYRGRDIGTWDGTTTQSYPLPNLGGRLELILTSDVTGGSFICHFQTGGGQIGGGTFNGSAGDYFVALPQ